MMVFDQIIKNLNFTSLCCVGSKMKLSSKLGYRAISRTDIGHLVWLYSLIANNYFTKASFLQQMLGFC